MARSSAPALALLALLATVHAASVGPVSKPPTTMAATTTMAMTTTEKAMEMTTKSMATTTKSMAMTTKATWSKPMSTKPMMNKNAGPATAKPATTTTAAPAKPAGTTMTMATSAKPTATHPSPPVDNMRPDPKPLPGVAVTNNQPYCIAQRRAGFPACRAFARRTDQETCSKVHQSICLDGTANLSLTCLHAVDLSCLHRSSPAECRAAGAAACNTPLLLLHEELKCASDGAGHFLVCQPARNGLNLYPCNEFLEQVCGPAFKSFPAECVAPCYHDCARKFNDGPRLVGCHAQCREACRPRFDAV